MRFGSCIVLLAIASTLGFSQQNGPTSQGQATGQAAPTASPQQQEYVELAKRFEAAKKSKDMDYFRRTLTDDFTEIGSNGGTSSKADFLEDQEPFKKPEAVSKSNERMYDFRVLPLNDGAVVVSYNKIEPGDTPRYTHLSTIWVKQDGDWKLKFLQVTPNLWSATDL
jgi:hypothetical protein